MRAAIRLFYRKQHRYPTMRRCSRSHLRVRNNARRLAHDYDRLQERTNRLISAEIVDASFAEENRVGVHRLLDGSSSHKRRGAV